MTGTVQEMHSIKKNVKTLEIIRASYTEVYYKIQDAHTTKFCFQLAQPKAQNNLSMEASGIDWVNWFYLDMSHFWPDNIMKK